MQHRNGLWWCGACGSYTTLGSASHKSSAKYLKKECARRPKGAGKDYLANIAKGYMPKRKLAWPQPEHCTLDLQDPFLAVPRTRLCMGKATLNLGQLEAQGLPGPFQDVFGDQPELVQELEEDPDPFNSGILGFDEA